MNQHSSAAAGALRVRRLVPPVRPAITSVLDAIRYGTPARGFLFGRAGERRAWQRANQANFVRSLEDEEKFAQGRLFAIGHLWGSVFRQDGSVLDLGLMSCRVVTDTGVGYVVDAFQNLVELENMRYHGLGTGGAAEAAGNTALTTELTTQYSSSNTRPTGTLGEKSGDSKTYETTATITVSAGVAATEHGIFSQAATGGGVMLDRTLFSVVNLASSESLATTYQITFPSNG
jgi:hypothetical protein